MNFKFSDVSERDMDILILEEFACSKDFGRLFLGKIGVKGDYNLLSMEHSKMDVTLGESDVVMIYETEGVRHALLIEDKIDAIAQERQCERYTERGEKGILDGEYSSYHVFIVCPQHYLETNVEAQKYENHVTYEEILSYFHQHDNDNRCIFKIQQIEQALYKEKAGYICVENPDVTSWWTSYLLFYQSNHSDLFCKNKATIKGGKSKWPEYRSPLGGFPIYYKTDQGNVDMQLPVHEDKDIEIISLLEKEVPDYELHGIHALRKKGNKSFTLGISVPVVDVLKTFEEQKELIAPSFDAIRRLCELERKLRLNVYKKKV